jgi:hypothetical protein
MRPREAAWRSASQNTSCILWKPKFITVITRTHTGSYPLLYEYECFENIFLSSTSVHIVVLRIT